MSRFFLFLLFLFTSGFVAQPASAYVRTISSVGTPLYWPSANPSITLNPTNSSGLSSSDVSTMLQNAFTSWHNTGANVGYAMSTNLNGPTASTYDGINSIYFASNNGATLGYGVIAITQVIYHVSSGQIVEFDMEFNDNQFLFTNTVGSTGQYNGNRYEVYLQDVATHEAGHAYGFDHSTVERSTLIYSAFSGQYTLGDDDNTAIRTVYPTSSGNGTISGRIVGTNGGIFGAHLSAINQGTGHVQAGTLANPDGTFTIGNIPPGDYVVMMEPLGTSPSTISNYWSSVNHQFCGLNKFRRSFYGACGSGTASTVTVSANANSQIGILTPNCTQMGNPGGAPTTVASAKLMNSNGGAMFGTISPGQNHYYRLSGISGNLTVRAMSYTLYSPTDVKVEILNASGGALNGANSIDNVESPMPGGYVNYDSSANVTGLSSGDYIVHVSGVQSIGANDYPAGYDLLDSSGHYLLIAEVNGAHGSNTVSDMSSCITVNNLVEAATVSAQSNQQSSGGGCGMIQSGGGSGGGGNFFGSSLFLLLLAAIGSKLMPKLARKRS